jgi:hypothetical protein
MTKNKTLKLALEALESFVKDDLTPEHYMKTIAAVKQALAAQPAPVQLTDEQIYAIGKELGMKCRLGGNPNIDLDYARAIEAAHSITKGETK